MKLTDKVALVTGGSEGIGYGIAAALLAEGCKVTITGRREDVLEQAASKLGVDFIVGDVGIEADAVRTVAGVVELMRLVGEEKGIDVSAVISVP